MSSPIEHALEGAPERRLPLTPIVVALVALISPDPAPVVRTHGFPASLSDSIHPNTRPGPTSCEPSRGLGTLFAVDIQRSPSPRLSRALTPQVAGNSFLREKKMRAVASAP